MAWCRAGGGRGEWQAPGRRCDCCYTMNHPQTGGVDNRLVALSECVSQHVTQGTAERARLRDVQGLGCVIPQQALRRSEASSLTRLAWTLPPTRPLPGRLLEHSFVSLLLGLGFLTEWRPQRGCLSYLEAQGWGKGTSRLTGGSHVALDDLASEDVPCLFCLILSVTRESRVRLDPRRGK